MKSTRNISAILIASLLFLATGPVSWAQPSVTIGTGTTTTSLLPTYGFYDYSWGVSIYLASEMAGYSGTISSISWYVDKPAGYSYTMLDQRIYLMHTTETIFPTTAAPTNVGMTKVFQGDITWTEGWFTINLTTPFVYNGTNNLMILVENYDGDYVTDYPTFRYTSTSANYRSKYKGKDGSYPTTDAGTRSYNRPNIRFTSPPVPNDGALTGVSQPTGNVPNGSNPVAVTFQNQGNNNITSATINWDVNGVAGTPYTYSGNLAPGASVVIPLGNGNFLLGNNTINATVASVNDGADGYAGNNNTTLTVVGKPSMSGAYTIGTGGTYATFNAAVTDLNASVLTGPVVFNVLTGTYTEQVTLIPVDNTSATNTITFKSNSGNPADVTLQFAPTLSTANYTVFMNGADFFRFEDMTIKSTSTGTYSRVISFDAGADYNTFDNCQIIGRQMNASLSSSNSTLYCSGANDANNNTFINNTIQYGTSIYFYSSSTTSSMLDGNMFEGNTISDFSYAGLYFYGAKNTLVRNNVITSASTSTTSYSTVYGLYMSYMDESNTVSGNRVTAQGYSGNYGAYVYYCDGTASSHILFANNIINVTGTSTSSTIYGLYDYNSNYVKFYHNTVMVDAGSSSSYTYYGYSSSSTLYGNIDVRNNIFANYKGARAVYMSSTQTYNYYATFDYNNLYTTGTNLAYSLSNYADLTSWRAATGWDMHSYNVDPIFVSTTNFTPQSGTMDNRGLPLALVPQDINNVNRSLTTPDLGAIEYTAMAINAGLPGFVAPGPISPVGLNQVQVTLFNDGSSAINTATIDWTVNGGAPTTYSYTGPLAPGASTVVSLGNANIVTGNNTLTATIASVNGGPDGYAGNNNATLTTLGKPAMSGGYTIGTGGDYPTFNAAVTDLNASALAGPVVFTVFAGTYNENVSLTAIGNASATNTVTFQSQTGDNTSVTLTSTASSTVNYTLRFDGADYVTFQNMTVETDASGTTYGRVVVFQNGSDYNNVENCILNGLVVSASSASNVAVVYGDDPMTYNKVSNNVINGGSSGIYLAGASASPLTGNEISGNTINGPTYYGIYATYLDDGIVKGNSITSSSNPYSTVYGIYLTYPDGNVDISGNDVNVQAGTTNGYGIYCYYGVGSASPGITIFNNAVILSGSPSTYAWGIGLNVANARVYHNTVSHSVTTGTTPAGLYINSTAATYTANEFVNNLLSCFSGAPAVNVTDAAITNGALSLLNYNNLYTNGAVLGTYGATACANLAEWKTATGQEANSRNLNPAYVSATNLTPESYSLDNKGTHLAAVPKDINGTNRSATTPDIGAIEFVAPTAAKITVSDTFWDFGLREYGQTYTKTIVIGNVGASAMFVPPVVDIAPFFCNINSLTTIAAGNSINCVISFTPTTSGVFDVYLVVNNSSPVSPVKIHLKGEAMAPGSLVEDFEGPVFPPLFWTVVQPPCSPTNNITRVSSAASAYSPTNYVRFSASGTCASGYDSYLITPQLITTAANRKFSFWYRRYSNTYAERFIVGWSSTGKDVATDFTWGDTLDLTNLVYEKYVKTDLPIGTKFVAIRYASEAPGYYAYLDDVFGPPVYYEPYLVDVTGLTANQTVPAAVSYNYYVKIENFGANADNFQLSAASAKGFSYTIRNKADNATISSIAIPSMQSDTVILKVTVSNGGITEGQTDVGKLMVVSSGNATVMDSAMFTTTVGTIPVQPPYLQNFSTSTWPASLWTEMDVKWGNPTPAASYGTSSDWGYDSDYANLGSPNGAAYINLWSTGKNEWLISPLFDLGSAKSIYRLEFDLALTDYADPLPTTLGVDDTLALVISLDGGLSWHKSNTLMLWHAGTPISHTGNHISVDLGSYSNGVRFGFYAQSTVSNADNDIFIDNFYVFDPTAVPLCTSPIAPVDDAAYQDAGLTLSWNATGNTTGYKLYFGTTDPPPFHSNLGNVTSFNTGALPFGTEYFWKVVPYNTIGEAIGCDVWSFTTMPVLTVPYVQDFSTYTASSTPVLWKEAAGLIGEPTTFTSLTSSWWVPEDFINTPSHPNGTCAGINIYGSGRADWLFSPLFHLGSGNNKLEFDLALTQWDDTAPDTLGVDDTLALVISLDTGKTWLRSNVLQLWHAGTFISDTGDHITVNLSAYSGIVQFGFYGVSTVSNKDNDIFIDNFSLLADGILGLVTYDNAAATPLAEISVNIASPPLTATTGMDGRYGFMPIANGTYNITGSSTAETGSINTTDALWVIKHAVSMNPLTGMPLLAAETDNIAGITANDALLIQQRYIKMITNFPAGNWKFETVTTTVNNATVSADFKGIATGDVNRSFVPGTKSASSVLLFEEGQINLDAGRLVEIPVYAATDMGLGAISLVFEYPADEIEIHDVSTAYGQQNMLWTANNGRLVISWMSLEAASVLPGSELLTISALVKSDATPSFRLGEGCEMADPYGEVIFNAAISMPKMVVNGYASELMLGCYPNPTSGFTTVSFSMEAPGQVSLGLFNAMGDKVMELLNTRMGSGEHQVVLDSESLPAGIYMIHLEAGDHQASQRLVVTR